MVPRNSIDDGLVEMRWMHALGGKSLPAASYGIVLNLKKKHFLPFKTDTGVVLVDNVFSSVLRTPAANALH